MIELTISDGCKNNAKIAARTNCMIRRKGVSSGMKPHLHVNSILNDDHPLLLSRCQSVDIKSINVMDTARDWTMTDQESKRSRIIRLAKFTKCKKKIIFPWRKNVKNFPSLFLPIYWQIFEVFRSILVTRLFFNLNLHKFRIISLYFQFLFRFNFFCTKYQ